ncbi:hypothetical protein TEA_026595 [Camellia sinensis var. sinensis]|uniref:Protein kinase domain-containing protein n=1 Tax=Camellia sinensis var. sinensis TaxID=542762 RepID=A0A4S4EUE4_CAMSN|nr:hypothetical protein TEA_026595 [Camellia sinensis var. sinensis]
MLEGGHDIAVKLLLKDSKQGVDEFKNEVICIARLQHRNLVKLLGYCIQGDKRILIYEFMPNNNLDSFIFEDRPSMASVVLMLGGEGALTHSKQPGFFTERNLLEVESTRSEVEQCSANLVSTTVVEA